MINEDADITSMPYFERRLIVVSTKGIVKAVQEESKHVAHALGFEWTKFATSAAKRVVQFDPLVLAAGVGAEVGIHFFKAWAEARKNGVPVIQISPTQADKLKFPPSHPQLGIVYVGHPQLPNVYVPAANFHTRMFEHKFSEAIRLLVALGATHVHAEHITGSSRDLEIVASLVVPSNGMASNLEMGASMKSNAGKSLHFEGTYPGTDKPQLPEDLVWFPHESNWQMIAETRLKSRMDKFSMMVSYLDDLGVNANLKAGVEKAKLQMGGKFEDHESSVWKLHGEFLAINAN
jgi:hypothetical protein